MRRVAMVLSLLLASSVASAQVLRKLYPDENVYFPVPSHSEKAMAQEITKSLTLPEMDPCDGMRIGYANATIRVGFVYDQSALDYFGSAAQNPELQLLALTQRSIDATNESLRYSVKGCKRVALVGFQKVDETVYVSTGDILADISWETVSPVVASFRVAHKADLVFFWIGRGLAGTGGLAADFNNDPAYGFSAVSVDMEELVVFHEFGHLLGAHHQPEDPTVPLDTTARGHYKDGLFRDAMAIWISALCPNQCPVIRRYSNPDVLFNGVPTGTPDRNNAAAIEKNWNAVAQYHLRLEGAAPINIGPQLQ